MIYHIALFDYNNHHDVSHHHYTTLPGYIDLTKNAFPTYVNDKANAHHYTTDYVFNTLYPYICSLFQLPYQPDNFIEECEYPQSMKLSRYIYKSNRHLSVYNIEQNTQNVETYDSLCHGNANSFYHTCFKYPHTSVIIINDNASTNRTLLLNTDSMSIPLIPLIIPMFKCIFVADRRSSYSNKPSLTGISFTDTLAYFIKGSIFAYKYVTNLL